MSSKDATDASAVAAAAAAAPAPLVAAETKRRDELIAAEAGVKARWGAAKAYEVDAPTDPAELAAKNKFMVTFPFPYMNGALHLGHAFSMTKAEFMVRFQRLLGKRALFPFGFHCTGMPILACAQKLQKEIAAFGNPPVFPVEKAAEAEEEADEPETPAAPAAEAAAPEAAGAAAPAAPADKKRKKKGKLAGKKSGHAYQWLIMREMGVPEAEIAKFCDPAHWLTYWPPIAQKDMNDFGVAVDWRRTFITTDANPFFDAFVRWQFNQLRAKDKLSYGKLMSIMTPSNKQVCSDHDRKGDGEGVMPQAYTAIKLRLQAPFPAALTELLAAAGLAPVESAAGDAAAAAGELTPVEVVLPAATLRPETMYGQTNAFVLPTGEYQVYRTQKNEVFVCTDRSALNMAFQDAVFKPFEGPAGAFTWGECANRKLGNLLGQHLLGCAIKAPLTSYEKVYILPLLTILMDKGTGIVTSVPSDAPADYAALMDMKNKPDFRAKFGIKDEMVLPFEVVPIIRIDELDGTDQAAPMLCKKYGVKSQNDAVLLAKIKDEVYKYGFDKGVMIVGPHAGSLVKDVKEAVKASMIADGLAFPYAEPESIVISRTEEECVVGLIDQWAIKYGEPEWQAAIRAHAESDAFQTYNRSVRARLLFTIGWLHQWGCSRAFGLGTRMEFDPAHPLIESLSDSTIYMAYYTIVALLQGGSMTEGKGPAGVKAEQLTDAVFSYVFLPGAEFPADCGIARETLDRMRAEFEFWYPFDLRVSGKDLLNNHLVMTLYNHEAVLGADKLPRSYYANGMLLINGQKMSKSNGTFITLHDAIKMYGADAARFGLASAGDSLDDANFSSLVANAAILRLSKELVFARETLADASLRSGEMTFWDRVFSAQTAAIVAEAKTAYEQMRIMDASRLACHELCNVRDAYRTACAEAAGGAVPMNKDVLLQWLRVFAVTLSPICPFWSQTMWDLIRPAFADAQAAVDLVCDAAWPVLAAPDTALLREAAYISVFCSNLRGAAARALTVKAKKAPKGTAVAHAGAVVRVATGYPIWQVKVISELAALVAAFPGEDKKEALANAAPVNAAVKALFPVDPAVPASKKLLTNAMAFASTVRAQFAEEGAQALELAMPFDEVKTVREHIGYLVRGIDGVTVETTTIEEFVPTEDGPISTATPGRPTFSFV